MDYLEARIKEHDKFQDDWTQMKDFYSRKLWHQLTMLVTQCLRKPGFASAIDLMQFDQVFLNSFKSKMNPLSLAEMLIPISDELVKQDPQKTVSYIEENRDKYMSLNDEAIILAQSTIGMIRLFILKDMPGARDIIESTGDIIASIDGVTPVHSHFYRMSSHYYKLMGQHTEYYREALRFLGCTHMSELSDDEKHDWAFSVGIAALLGQKVYNFGELICHEVLETLRLKRDAVWLVDLLHAFNKGDLKMIDELKPQWSAVKDLADASKLLEEKALLLALMEMFFRKPSNQQTVSFDDIASATKMPLDKVEHLVMRALSLSLIRGRIDEVNRRVTVTWLQPRVLDLDQIGSMATRLLAWQKSVTSVQNLISAGSK